MSIPNVTHGALRLSLLEGRFNYTEQGLLDRTHLRFFDRHAAEQLISEAGLTISQHLRVRRELEETEIAVNKDGLPTELLQSLASDPDATTYQFVFVAGRTNGSAMRIRSACCRNGCSPKTKNCVRSIRELRRTRRAWKPSGRKLESLLASAQFKELETYTRNLEADHANPEAEKLKRVRMRSLEANRCTLAAIAESLEVQRERDELRQELIRRTQEAHQMHRDLRHSKADVVVKDAFISDLRQQLRQIDPLVSQRDQLLAKRDQLVAEHKKVSAKCKQLIARRDQLVEERRLLSARQQVRKNTARSANLR